MCLLAIYACVLDSLHRFRVACVWCWFVLYCCLRLFELFGWLLFCLLRLSFVLLDTVFEFGDFFPG